jgi:zinc transport system permease protein
MITAMELFQYNFILRGFAVGMIVGAIAPLLGIFLVLRRYSLIADTLSHVSLAGVAIGLLTGISPIITAIGTSVVASVFIDRLRSSRKIYGESALALFLSGSLALAVIFIGLAHGFTVNLFSYLFGSITTVKPTDVAVVVILGIFVIGVLAAFYKELVFISFDEDQAKVSGIPTKTINTIFILLTGLTVAISMPIIGVLLVSALMVIPVVAALQLKKNFFQTVLFAEAISLFSIASGIISSFYLNLPTGGTIVLIALLVFCITYFIPKK